LPTRIAIADDHAIVRTGLRLVITSAADMELVGEAAGGYEAIDLAERLRPDVLLLDLSMPDLDGITVTRRLHERFPNLKILILTIHEDEALLRTAIQAGASGYVLKRAAEAELVSAIGVVLRGDLYVDPSLVRALVTSPPANASQNLQPGEALSARELEVLKLIVQGYTNRQVGTHLNISVRTVESHRANLAEKLGLHSRVDLVRYAREHGLIE
jgi:two-component system response regulator NreC